MTLTQQKKLMLNYSFEKVEEVIVRICSLDGYLLKETNELTNTYTVIVHKGGYKGVIANHLTKVDDNKTLCSIGLNTAEQGDESIDILMHLQDAYLKLLTGVLAEKVMIKKRQAERYYKKHISHKTFLLVIFIIATLLFLMLRMLTED